MEEGTGGGAAQGDPGEARARRHVRIGWALLLGWLTLGIALEAMHGFKVAWYLDVSNETRRLMLRLAHAHGVLLGLVNVAFGFTLRLFPAGSPGATRFASRSLLAASLLLPGGFLLGGLRVYGGDPGVGVLLVPAGAALLFAAILVVVRITGVTPPRQSPPR